MKKAVATLLLMVSVLLLFGCANSKQTTHGYVSQVTEDGVYVGVNGFEEDIYVKCENADQISVFDTIVIEYKEEDLKESSGTYPSVAGGVGLYTYVVEAISVRQSDPSKGEPLFG